MAQKKWRKMHDSETSTVTGSLRGENHWVESVSGIFQSRTPFVFLILLLPEGSSLLSMLSNGFRRKAAKKSDAFSAFPFDTQASSSVVVTVRTVLKPKAKPTTSNTPECPLPSQLVTPVSSASSSPRSSAKPHKRKRDASPQAHTNARNPQKRERVSDSPSPRSARSSQPSRPVHAFGSLEKPIPRPCVIAEDGEVPHVTSEDVIMRILRQQEDFGKKTKWGYRACQF